MSRMKPSAPPAAQCPPAACPNTTSQDTRRAPPWSCWRTVLRLVADAVVMVDAGTGIIVEVNAGACRLLGRPADKLVGQHQTILHPPGEYERHAALFRDVVATTDTDAVTVRSVTLRRHDGTNLPCVVSNVLVQENDRPIIVGVFRQADATQQAEQALRESERRFRLLVENSPDAFFLHDMGGTIVDVNQRACELVGYAADELVGSSVSRLETLCPPQTLAAIWDNVRPGGFNLDGEARRKDGSVFPVEVQGVVFREQGRSLCLVSVRDMSARKALEQSLMQALEQTMAESREKCVFLASISHEIRTPLNIILGMVDMLRAAPSAEARRNYLDAVEHAGQMLLRLVNDILDLSRIEAGTLALRPAVVDPGELLRTVGEVLRPSIIAKGLAFRLELDEALPRRLWIDPERLRQILVNLLWNAIKFTDQGEILLEARQMTDSPHDAYWRVCVADTGRGIPTHELERIFLPFIQVDPGLGGAKDGAGLGLAISKRLVERLGGRLWVESLPRAGSRFFFTLPLTPPPAAAEPAKPVRQPEPAPEPARIARVLLVEDSPASQELLRLYLENEPFRLDVAGNGHEALRLFAAQRFDCILMDVEMAGLDGYQTTAAMRHRERERGDRPTPIVLLTAHDFSEFATKGRQAGCDGYLAKPIRKARLLEELHRILSAAS